MGQVSRERNGVGVEGVPGSAITEILNTKSEILNKSKWPKLQIQNKPFFRKESLIKETTAFW